jgi:hypothetical protein
MAMPRSRYVDDNEEGVFHCVTRCVRRAFLSGYDSYSKKDYSHRKSLILNRMRFLTTIFAIEVLAYCIMDNHYHDILRTLPGRAALWSNIEVARRWLTLFPNYHLLNKLQLSSLDERIQALAQRPEIIEILRKRLSNLSWFMAQLNEFIARVANNEDNVKGRFWESRFKAKALLDDAAILTGMVYVDLNPIRAGMATTPEDCDFTSIQERIRDWNKDNMNNTAPADTLTVSSHHVVFQNTSPLNERDIEPVDATLPEPASTSINHPAAAKTPGSWLCPISPDADNPGILQLSTIEYFDLVDRTGRMFRADKRGAIDADLLPILLRIGARPETWMETVSVFESRFRLAAGMLDNLRSFAHKLGSRWLVGVSAAKSAFALSLPQST